MNKSISWAILAGPARSGTTYLRQLISSHPQAALFHEYGLHRVWRSLEILRPEHTEEPHGMTWNSAPEPNTSAPSDLGRNQLAQGLYENVFQRSGLTLLGDKMALGANSTIPTPPPGLEDQVRYVLLLRRPSSVLASSMARHEKTKQGLDDWPVSSVGEAAAHLMDAWRAMRTLSQAGVEYILVKYEDLLAAPRETAERIFNFLELSPPPHILNIQGRSGPGLIDWEQLTGFPHLLWLEEHWDERTGAELLAQDETPPTLRFGQELKLDAEDAKGVLRSGFSVPEPHGTWTDGPLAILALRHPETIGDIAVKIGISAAHGRRGSPCVVDVDVNGNKQQRLQLPNGFGLHRLVVGANHINRDRTLVLSLKVPHPKTAHEEPRSDLRQLGVAVASICLERA